MTVLVCTDFSAASAAAEREAARRFPDATLIVFHATDPALIATVVQLTGDDGARLRDGMLSYADERMSEVVERLGSQGRRVRAELAEGDPPALALRAAEAHRAELVVIGIHPSTAGGRFRTALARRTRVPVLLVPSDV